MVLYKLTGGERVRVVFANGTRNDGTIFEPRFFAGELVGFGLVTVDGAEHVWSVNPASVAYVIKL